MDRYVIKVYTESNFLAFLKYHLGNLKRSLRRGIKRTHKKPIVDNYERNGSKYVTYTNLPLKYSAFETFSKVQKILFTIIFLILVLFFILHPYKAAVIIIAFLTFIYFLDFLFTDIIIFRAFGKNTENKVTKEELAELDDNSLPKYTILCPMYKEWEVIEQFSKAIDILDWPKNKLEVILLLEEDDVKTIQKAIDLHLPSHFRLEIVPNSLPKTKPKACNYGLIKATGEYIVVYDAEDKPDPLQLKISYLTFKKLPDNVICLQSKLNYYNAGQNLLTRLFTAEYSYWFDIALPGLQSLDTIIPLGGTSNHFKTEILKNLHGWDPFNVTEDCDLGTRLFKEGYRTSVINSETLEEANSNLKSWIKQRSRWIKGYMQTYLVHMRNPVKFLRKEKQHFFIFQLMIGMRMVFMIINPFFWLMTIIYFTLYSYAGPFIESLYPWYIFYPAVFCLIFANFTYFYSYMIGLAKKEKWGIISYVFLIPFYWILTSISAGIALYQLITKPYYWEKTKHGLFNKQPDKDWIISPQKLIYEPAMITDNSKISLNSEIVFEVNKKNIQLFKYLNNKIDNLNYDIGSILKRLQKNNFTKDIFIAADSLLIASLSFVSFTRFFDIDPKKYLQTIFNNPSIILIFIASLSSAIYNLTKKRNLLSISGFILSIFIIFSRFIFNADDPNFLNNIYRMSVIYVSISVVVEVYKHLKTPLYVNLQSLYLLLKSSKTSENKKSFNILIFNWRDTKHKWQGGAEKYIQELSEMWVKRDCGVTIFCGSDGYSDFDDEINNVRIIRRGGFFTVYFWALIYYIFKLRNNYDFIIDCENGIPFFTPLYSSKPKILLIHHVHQKIFRENLPLPASLLAMFLESKVMKYLYKNTKIVTVSNSSRKDIADLGLSSEAMIDIVNPGVNFQNYIKLEKYEDPTFLYLGRLMPYKNIDLLVKAFKELLKSYPSSKLIIAGKGPSDEFLRNLVVNLNISESVKFMGYVDDQKKTEILSKSWVLVQPSSFEGWGITVTEANASGTPVIASNTSGLRDSVIDGITGILVDKNNPIEIFKSMKAMIEMSGLRERMSENAYLYAKRFSWSTSSRIFMGIIENEITSKKGISFPGYVYSNYQKINSS